MNTEELIDTTLTTLKVIGMLPKNGRLCVRRGQLTLESDDHMQRFKRWVYRDSREVTLSHIKNTINNATKIIKGIMSSQIDIEMKTWTLQRFLSEMTSCQSGLVNLKTTYINDTAIVATLDVICERLQANCAELSEWDRNDGNGSHCSGNGSGHNKDIEHAITSTTLHTASALAATNAMHAQAHAQALAARARKREKDIDTNTNNIIKGIV